MAEEVPNYNAGMGKGLGIAHIVLGGICFVCGIVVLVIYSTLWSYITGACEIWLPIIFIATGILGVAASRSSTRNLIMAYMVLSIISCVGSLGLFVAGCRFAPLLSVHIAILIFGFAEFVVAVMSSVITGRAVCSNQ